jgi:dienelactone hydrolase/FtsH-binding integral membrane protein
MATITRQAPTESVHANARERRKRGSWLAVTVLAIEGVALIVLGASDGSVSRRLLRLLVVAAAIGAAVWIERRGNRVARGTSEFAIGIVGVIAGAGVGGVYLAEAGSSVKTAAALAALLTGLVLLLLGSVALIRSSRGWWRLLAVPVGLLLLAFVLYPLTIAVNLTNRPATALGSTTPRDMGLAYQDVSIRTADGVQLSAWYLPSTNGAAVVLLPGAGSTRSSVLPQAAVLARGGYGVLMLDTRGHGSSGGTAMDAGWYGNLDISAAVSFLEARPDVHDGMVGAVGMSMGGEQSIAAAGSDPRIRAVVSEGTTGMQMADHAWLDHYWFAGWVTQGIDWVTYTGAGLLSHAPKPTPLRDAIASAAPHPVLLIAAGNVPDEKLAGQWFQQGSPATVELLVVPSAGHTGGLAADPAQWESRVMQFLNDALLGR